MLSTAFTQTVRKLKPVLYHNQCTMFIQQKAKIPQKTRVPSPRLYWFIDSLSLIWRVVCKLRLNLIITVLTTNWVGLWNHRPQAVPKPVRSAPPSRCVLLRHQHCCLAHPDPPVARLTHDSQQVVPLPWAVTTQMQLQHNRHNTKSLWKIARLWEGIVEKCNYNCCTTTRLL